MFPALEQSVRLPKFGVRVRSLQLGITSNRNAIALGRHLAYLDKQVALTSNMPSGVRLTKQLIVSPTADGDDTIAFWIGALILIASLTDPDLLDVVLVAALRIQTEQLHHLTPLRTMRSNHTTKSPPSTDDPKLVSIVTKMLPGSYYDVSNLMRDGDIDHVFRLGY